MYMNSIDYVTLKENGPSLTPFCEGFIALLIWFPPKNKRRYHMTVYMVAFLMRMG